MKTLLLKAVLLVVSQTSSALQLGELFPKKVANLLPLKKQAPTTTTTTTTGVRCAELWGGAEGPDILGITEMCSEDVRYEDLSFGVLEGPAAVSKHLTSKFPTGARLEIEKIAGDGDSGGFTWHRASVGSTSIGLRGTLFARMEQGKLTYVREASEPIFKMGQITEALLKAATSNVEKVDKIKTYTPRTPQGASDTVQYLWREAYPGGASNDVALELFADDIVYEDFNYDTPFIGKDQVAEFLDAFDIPGIEFQAVDISKGQRACVFTWKVSVNGADGPDGLSFYSINDQGKIDYIRDIPATKPAPLQTLASYLSPRLRVFS